MKIISDKPLVINSFTKKYGKFRGVEDINLEIKQGEIFGFLGPNGSGKSTTIRTILDFIKPTEGSISIYGLDSVKDSVKAKNYVGYLAGDIALYKNMTGRQIIKYLTSLGKNTDESYVKELVDKLNASLDRPISTLSKGNKQKIGLIQAFMHKPNLLILDEPTSGLDPLMKQVFYDIALDMKKQGKTIFVSSHDLTEVKKICDRAAFIREGKLIAIEDIKNADGLNLRRYSVKFNQAPNLKAFEKIKNVSELQAKDKRLLATVTGDVSAFIGELAKQNVADLTEQETDLEDLFMHYYKKEDKDV